MMQAWDFVDARVLWRSQALHDVLSLRVEDQPITVRTLNCLRSLSDYDYPVETLGELVTLTEPELLRVPNFGRKSLRDVKEMLAGHGLSLAGN